MTYFWVDDRLWGHPKWLGTPAGARALWVTAGSWCAANLTDGRVPKRVLAPLGGRTRDARALVDAGLWIESVDGWEFKNWQEWQKSREEVEEKRAQARERMQRLRTGRKNTDGSREQDANVRANNERSSHDVREPVPSRPVPTQPNPVLGEVVRRLSRGRTTTTTDDEIAQWQSWAGPAVDLDAECKAWLLHNADVDLDNPRAALKGWLERARDRQAGTAPAPSRPPAPPTAGRPTPTPSRPECPRHPGHPPVPACPRCARDAVPAPPGLKDVLRRTEPPAPADDDGPEF